MAAKGWIWEPRFMSAEKGVTRDRILRTTLELVGRDGVGNLTNRRVAKAAGVSLGSLTYHFDSQTTLLRESLELFITEETQRLQLLADGLRDADLTLDQGVAALQALLGQDPERRIAKMELYLQATRDPEIREAALRCFSAYDRLAASALAAIGIKDPDQMSTLLVAIIDGLQLRRLAAGGAELPVAEPLTKLLRAIQPD